jgi:hypothetical protein
MFPAVPVRKFGPLVNRHGNQDSTSLYSTTRSRARDGGASTGTGTERTAQLLIITNDRVMYCTRSVVKKYLALGDLIK